MEALKTDLNKAVHDCMEAIYEADKENGVLIKGQLFAALSKTVESILSFCESKVLEMSAENEQLTKANDGLKRTVDRLIQGISQMDVNANENREDLQVEQLKQENTQLKATIEELLQKVSYFENKIKELEACAYDAPVAAATPEASTAAEAPVTLESTLPANADLEMELNVLRVELEEKNKAIASLEEENHQHVGEKVELEKNVAVFKKINEDLNKQILKLERIDSRSATPISAASIPISRPEPTPSPLPGNPEQYILLKDATVDGQLNLELLDRKIVIVKRLLNTADNMVWDAYSTLDDENEKPIKINIKYATNFKLHLNGLLSIHKKITPFLFNIIDSCSLTDLRLYYITISYPQLLKLFGSSNTIKTFYSIFVVIKDEHQADMQINQILREVSNLENLSFVFPNQAQITADNFAQLPNFPNLKKVTFGNIPATINEFVIYAFKKKYPTVACYYTWNDSSLVNDNRSNR